MSPVYRFERGFGWGGVERQPYKDEGADEHFCAVDRQLLFGAAEGLPFEGRYFEIEPGGYSTLERHEHPHAVMILRGEGQVLIDRDIEDVRPFDVVHVPAATWHQFQATPDAPLGFVCVVSTERDRPQRPDDAQLTELRSDPKVAEFIRIE